MIVVHIAAIPMEKEQRCLRCCKKLIEIDPTTDASFRPSLFVAVEDTTIIGVQETDAGTGQVSCKPRGRHS